MAKLTRKTLIQFGNAGASSNFGQFGSKTANSQQTSQDPTVIQQLTAWIQGWQNAIVTSNKAAYLQDMNGWCYVHSYMAAYMFQAGIPEWDSGTTYYTNSFVQVAGQIFISLQDTNLGNAPPASASNAFWTWVNPPQNIVGAAATLNVVPKVSNTAPANGFSGSISLSDSHISDDGVDVKISLPLKFNDATIQSTAAQPVQNQNVVTGSRALGSTYQNTIGRAMFIAVSCSSTNNGSIAAVTDSALNPTTQVANMGTDVTPGASTLFVFFIVLPGNYYKITATGTTLVSWVEWN